MQFNNLPGTSLYMSALSLGTMMFGGQTNEAESLAIMDYAFEQGINFVDTANAYNDGESERIVGKGLKGKRDKIFLATKVYHQMGKNPFDKGLSRRSIVSAIDASLKRLDVDYLDLYYLHAPDSGTEIEETLETMTNLVRQGTIRYIGVSNFAAWQVADILAVCEKRGYIAPVITQNIYNVITRSIETELVPFLAKHKMGLAVFNPIAAGLLSGKHRPGKPAENTRFANNKFSYDMYWTDDNFLALEKLTAIAETQGMSILQLALKWCLSHPYVTSMISGVSKISQIKQNIALVDGKALKSDVLAACDKVWRSLVGNRLPYSR